ncbi:vWA domain-containing protein, partial [Desulfosarcina cetonica]|uniref:hypothetical protein n=1 Tax=Desulfosarcina cetonica TaxID=90730 RepID=UPI0012ED9FF2
MGPSEAFKSGQVAYSQSPDTREKFVSLHLAKIEKESASKRRYATERIQACTDNLAMIAKELNRRGAESFTALMQNGLKILIFTITAIITIPGEFMFTVFTLRYLGMEMAKIYLMSAAIMVVSFEAFDLYLRAYRSNNPQHDNVIFAFFGLLSVISVIALFYFLCHIRSEMLSINTLTSLTGDPEKTLELTERFYKNNGASNWVMVFLTMTFLIVTSVSYHLTKALVIGNFVVATLYLRRYFNGRRIAGLQKVLDRTETAVETFLTDFEKGLIHAELRSGNRYAGASISPQRTSDAHLLDKLLLYLMHPISISFIVMAIIIFLVPRITRGAEYIIAIDISKSVAAGDYVGTSEFDKNMGSIAEVIKRLDVSDSIKVIAISDHSFTRPQLFMDERISTEKGLFGEIVAKDKVRIEKEWKDLNIKPSASSTDIFGALNFASIL